MSHRRRHPPPHLLGAALVDALQDQVEYLRGVIETRDCVSWRLGPRRSADAIPSSAWHSAYPRARSPQGDPLRAARIACDGLR